MLILRGALGADLAQGELEILHQRGKGTGQGLAPADHHIIAALPRVGRHDQLGGGAQTTANPVANNGVPHLSADGEPDAQNLRGVAGTALRVGGGAMGAHLQDQARSHPFTAMSRDKQEFPPPLEAGESTHG